MNIQWTTRHLEVDDEVKNFFMEKLGKLDKYEIRITGSSVALSHVKNIFLAEIKLTAKNLVAHSEAESGKNIFVAIEEAVEKIEAQVRKHKEKVKDHHARDEQ